MAIRMVREISSSPSIRMEENKEAAWFGFEEDRMYSQRESELIQQYLQEHGKMSGGGKDELDDLF